MITVETISITLFSPRRNNSFQAFIANKKKSIVFHSVTEILTIKIFVLFLCKQKIKCYTHATSLYIIIRKNPIESNPYFTLVLLSVLCLSLHQVYLTCTPSTQWTGDLPPGKRSLSCLPLKFWRSSGMRPENRLVLYDRDICSPES